MFACIRPAGLHTPWLSCCFCFFHCGGGCSTTGFLFGTVLGISFTGEDVAEFHVHGSRAVIRSTIESLTSVPVRARCKHAVCCCVSHPTLPSLRSCVSLLRSPVSFLACDGCRALDLQTRESLLGERWRTTSLILQRCAAVLALLGPTNNVLTEPSLRWWFARMHCSGGRAGRLVERRHRYTTEASSLPGAFALCPPPPPPVLPNKFTRVRRRDSFEVG